MSARRARCSRRRSTTRLAEPRQSDACRPERAVLDRLDERLPTTRATARACRRGLSALPGRFRSTRPSTAWRRFFGALSIDLHAKARVALQEVDGLSGLLPIAVRTPKPQTVAAVFYDAGAGRTFLNAKVLREATIPGLTAGLGGWTRLRRNDPKHAHDPHLGPDGRGDRRRASRRACNASATPPVTTNCLSTAGFGSIDDFCRQGGGTIVTCYYATGSGATQTTQAPLAFVRGYTDSSPTNTQAPQLESVWLTPVGCGDGYFNAAAAACTVMVNAQIDTGGRAAADVEVGVAGGSCGAFGEQGSRLRRSPSGRERPGQPRERTTHRLRSSPMRTRSRSGSGCGTRP